MVAEPLPASERPANAAERPSISWRAALLSLALAVFFGYVIPIIDMKMRNTFLGATHFPPGAIAVLLVLLLVVNPVLHSLAKTPSKLALLSVFTVLAAAGAVLLNRRGLNSDNLGFAFWMLCALAAVGIVVLLLGRRPLARNEVLVVYISCLFSCLAPGHGAENVFVVNLIGPFYYATDANRWLDFLKPYIKPWLTPALSADSNYGDGAREAVAGWFLSTPGGDVPWGAWLVPLVVWGFFIFVLYAMMACLCVLLRKQWVEREALAFPLLRLPLEMTEDVDAPRQGVIGDFFRNPLMWVGFGIAFFIEMMRGLHLYYADFPDFPTTLVTTTLLTELPWSQMGGVQVKVWPVIVGITYLLTAEISFSFWFFYWFIKLQLIVAYFSGYMPSTLPNAIGSIPGGSKSFALYQQVGCYLAYVAIMIYTGREHLGHIVLRALGRRRADADENEEALSYPVAFWGFFGCLSLLLAWSIAAGLSPLLACLMWGLYLVIIIALTRIICEAGLLFVQQGWGPLGSIAQITNAGGNHWLLPESSIPPATLIQGSLMTDLRGILMPSFMQGFKLAFDRKIPLKPLLGLMLVCSLISMALGVYMNTKLGYQQGGLTLDGWYATAAAQQPATTSASMLKGVKEASWLNLGWVGLGVGLTYLLMLARSRFAWFPLHPIGFLTAQTYPVGDVWFSIFLGWLAKVSVTRFGGTETYRKSTPLFLGLALGDVAMMLFWLVIDGWQGRVGHKLMPG
jgi:hypothetical protein